MKRNSFCALLGLKVNGVFMTVSTDFQTSCYSLKTEGSLVVLHFSGDIFQLGTSLSEKERLLSALKLADASPAIKAILFLNSPEVLGDKKYTRFVKEAIKARHGQSSNVIQAKSQRNSTVQLERLTNMITQLVSVILASSKLVIVGLEGHIASPFLGVSLVADYRFGTDEMTFQPSHIKLGTLPIGGLGFMLPRFVGQEKARDLLLSQSEVSAHDLEVMGLLDGHFPQEGFQDACIRKANELADIPHSAIKGFKAVSHPYAKDLKNFLQYENTTFLNLIHCRKSERCL